MSFNIAEFTFKTRKDKCLDEAEEAYKIDHDIEAYKKKVADFMFPNANTSRRIKKIIEEANNSTSNSDQNKPLSKELVPTPVVTAAPVTQPRKKKTPLPESQVPVTVKTVEHESVKEVTKVSKISSDKQRVEATEPVSSLFDKIADVVAKKRKEEDVLSNISEKESISSTLPS